MINNFTSVITWFKDMSAQLLGWFFDTSNLNKVLLFIVPLFVIAAIFVLFDFIIPMFYDLPHWRLNRQLAVMTPKNTYGLVINKHLIPRTPYSLRRMFMSRFSGGIIKGYNSKTLKAFSTKDIKPFQSRDLKGFKVSDLKGFKVSDLKGFKVYDLRNFKTADIRVLKSNDLRSLSTSELRSFTPDKISDFNIRPISTIKLGALTPAEIRSFKVFEVRPFKVADMRAFSVRDLRRMHLNSMVVSSHTLSGLMAYRYRTEGINGLRIASPSYSINTAHDLTKLGHLTVNSLKSRMKNHDLYGNVDGHDKEYDDNFEYNNPDYMKRTFRG